MKIGPKYKIARRLGAPIFEKTQSQKYALSEARKSRTRGGARGRKGGRGGRSEYGKQLIEKQKARLMYGVTEKQFGNYVKKAVKIKDVRTTEALYQLLERRLDNAVYKIGFAPSRRAARQMVSHGHITINGRKVTIPSLSLSIGDVIGIREGSKSKGVFVGTEDRTPTIQQLPWIIFDSKQKIGTVKILPTLEHADLLFDLNAIVEFYSR